MNPSHFESTAKVTSQRVHRRQDLDCLRAVAVLAVVLFHIDIPHLFGGAFRAGFLGVDIFFVISGYLITGNIIKKLESGSFSLLKFYSRRVWRLMPAFFVTVLAVALAAVWLMNPTQIERLGESIFYTGIHASNFFFWLESGYFDTSSEFKPFLHTWSLAVEEQFYLTWPVLLILLFNRRPIVWISAIGIASVIAAELLVDSLPNSVFYLMPFRVFEFAMGAVLVWLERRPITTKHVNLLAIICIIVLIGSFSYFQESSRMPGLTVLPPLIATTLLISLRAPLLVNDSTAVKTLAWVGRISYSMYLVHWPIVVFYRIANNGLIVNEDLPALVVLILGATLLLYYLIERPTQFSKTSSKRRLAIIPLGILIAVLFNSVGKKAFFELRSENHRELDRLLVEKPDGSEELESQKNTATESSNSTSLPKIIILGDSHSMDVLSGLRRANKPKTMDLDSIRSFCDPLYMDPDRHDIADRYSKHVNKTQTHGTKCLDYHAGFYNTIREKQADIVIFSERWDKESIPYAYETFAHLKNELDLKVIVLGPNQEFAIPPDMILTYANKIANVNKAAAGRRKENIKNPRAYRDIPGIDNELRIAAERAGVTYIDKIRLVCPRSDYCDYVHNGQVTYKDQNHWSKYGQKLFTQRILANEKFKAVFREVQN